MKNILISNPNSYDFYIYVPYIYGVLRWMCDQLPILKENLNWYKPIYNNGDVSKLLQNYDLTSVDVLGLSCYTWNRELNYKIAEAVKNENPNCIVIAGGPDPDSEDNPDIFLSKYPLIDIIVKRDANYSFPLVMERIVNDTYNFKNITGLTIKGFGDTGEDKNYSTVHGSVYTEYSDVFSEIVLEILKVSHKPVQVVESDRGCPYSCAFCYRGRYANKEASLIPLEYVYQDIDWGGKNRIYYIDIGNSNWGRYKRDIDVSNKLVETKSIYGYPKLVYYSGAKTNSENISEMLKVLNESNMLQHHAIALQTTNQDALKAAQRINMPQKEYLYLAQIAAENNIPSGTQFIMGCPGDTYEGVKKTCSDVMDMGFLDIFMVLPYQLLPGSWAYTKEYRDKWELETIVRHNQRQRRKLKKKIESTSETEYIVGCKTYTREDYIKMWRYYAIFLAFVGGNISRFLSVYLKLNHSVSYYDFYSGLVEDFNMNPEYKMMFGINKSLYKHQRRFVSSNISSTEAFWEFQHNEIDHPAMFEYDECLLISILLNFDKFKQEFTKYIMSTYRVDKIQSILQFQLDIIITQDYKDSKIITSEYNWVEYFNNVKSNRWIGQFDEPKNEYIKLKIDQTHSGTNGEWLLKWHNKLEYVDAVVGPMYNRNTRNSFDINSMVRI